MLCKRNNKMVSLQSGVCVSMYPLAVSKTNLYSFKNSAFISIIQVSGQMLIASMPESFCHAYF